MTFDILDVVIMAFDIVDVLRIRINHTSILPYNKMLRGNVILSFYSSVRRHVDRSRDLAKQYHAIIGR